MPTFEELKRRYMVGGATSSSSEGGSLLSGGNRTSTTTAITTYQNSQVTPLICGGPYFQRLKQLITALGSGETSRQFIYICGWWLDVAFSLDSLTGTSRIVDLLKQKARAGVDVRVLGWVMAPELMRNSLVQRSSNQGIQGMFGLNADTMRFINELRREPSLDTKACLNILAHPAGAVHLKMVLIGNGDQVSGFTGGLDLKPDRHHNRWHDVQAEVTGPAVQGLFDAFRQMWNEVRGRTVVRLTANRVTCDSHRSGMPNLAARTFTTSSTGRMHVQSLRTLPQYRFASLGAAGLVMTLPTNQALSYAPTGVTEIKSAWQQGIGGAQTYIYIEDQAFTSREVFDWINARVRANSELKVILVIGQWDPNDAPNSIWGKLMTIAVNNHLLRGLTGTQFSQIGLFTHRRKTIHTKSTIVDDQWALIGSANSMRRSLYTDFEHSVAYMDETSQGVPAYRRDLWGVHLQRSYVDLNTAINAWFAIPFRGSGTPSSTNFERVPLPLANATLTADEQIMYDEIYDADSRQRWGGQLINLFMRNFGAGALSP